MKIGLFTDSYLPRLDGVATAVDSCARALEKRGHEVYIIAPRYPRYKDTKKNIFRLTSVKFIDSPETRWALQLPERPMLQILRLNLDIIHGHNGGGITFLGLQVARAKDIPFVCTYHTRLNLYAHYFLKGKLITPRMLELISKFVANLCNYVIAPSESVKHELISYGVKKPIQVLPSGIDLEIFKDVHKGFIRKKLNISNEKKILLHVGRLGKEKSIDFIIRSFVILHKNNPDSVLVLVGDGSEKQNLKKLVRDLNLTNYIYFFGVVDHSDISKVYADGDIFVFASKTETQGLVILEAFASGLPVVALKDAALKNVLRDKKNSYVVKEGEDVFAKKISLLLNNKDLYKQFSEQAKKDVSKFSVDNTAKYLEGIYEKLIMEQEKKPNRNKIVFSIKNIKNHLVEFLEKANNQLNKLYE